VLTFKEDGLFATDESKAEGAPELPSTATSPLKWSTSKPHSTKTIAKRAMPANELLNKLRPRPPPSTRPPARRPSMLSALSHQPHATHIYGQSESCNLESGFDGGWKVWDPHISNLEAGLPAEDLSANASDTPERPVRAGAS
jgi:hypothetical protein